MTFPIDCLGIYLEGRALKFQAFRICNIKDNQTENNYAKQNQIFLRCLTLIINEGKLKKTIVIVNLKF